MEGSPHEGRTSPHLPTSADHQLALPAGGSDSGSGLLLGTPVNRVTQEGSPGSRLAVEGRADASSAEPAGPSRRPARRAAGPAAADVAAAEGERVVGRAQDQPRAGPGARGRGAGLPPTSAEPVVVIREGCPACAQEVREAPGVLVLSMTRTQGGEGGKLNPRANPFPIIVGKQSREDVVQAMERVLAGEPVSAVAGRAGLLMHHSYEGPQSLGLDDAIWSEVQRLAGLVAAGKRLFLRCGRGCCCPCDVEQLACHARAWQRVVTGVASGQSAPVRQGAGMDPASDAVSRAGGKLLLDLFGGDQPVVAEAARANGFVAARLDICLDAEQGDVSNDEVMAPWARECAAGRVASLKSDVPCQSFTCLRARPVQPGQAPAPPLRSRALLPELPPTPPEWKVYMAKHEKWVATTFDLGTDVLLKSAPVKGRFLAEGPIDRGNVGLKVNGTTIFRKEYADHAPLELHPRVLRFLAETGARVVYAFQCACRGVFQKGTALIADRATAEALQPLADLPCVHTKHEKEAVGFDDAGESNSHASRVYPHGFAEALTMAVTGSTAAEVEAVVRPIFLGTVRAAAAVGVLHTDHTHLLLEAEAAAGGEGAVQS